MTSTIQDPSALNDLLTELMTELLDPAAEGLAGGAGQVAALSSVQRLKLHAARRVADLAMKQLGRVQDPQERLRRLAELTDRYLPAVVEGVGEEAVQARLERLPKRLRSPEVVRLFEAAGATELGRLLAGGEGPSAPVAAGTAQAAPAPARPAEAKQADRAPAVGDPSRLELLRSQIQLLETMHRQIEDALPGLRRALEEELARAR